MLQAPLLDGLNCGSMNERLATSVEVTASKIFPAGAGWQLASIVADSAGFAPPSLAFFAANVGLVRLLVRAHAPSPLFREGRLARQCIVATVFTATER